MFYLMRAWTNDLVNNRDTGGLKHHCTHYGVSLMFWLTLKHTQVVSANELQTLPVVYLNHSHVSQCQQTHNTLSRDDYTQFICIR